MISCAILKQLSLLEKQSSNSTLSAVPVTLYSRTVSKSIESRFVASKTFNLDWGSVRGWANWMRPQLQWALSVWNRWPLFKSISYSVKLWSIIRALAKVTKMFFRVFMISNTLALLMDAWRLDGLPLAVNAPALNSWYRNFQRKLMQYV